MIWRLLVVVVIVMGTTAPAFVHRSGGSGSGPGLSPDCGPVSPTTGYPISGNLQCYTAGGGAANGGIGPPCLYNGYGAFCWTPYRIFDAGGTGNDYGVYYYMLNGKIVGWSSLNQIQQGGTFFRERIPDQLINLYGDYSDALFPCCSPTFVPVASPPAMPYVLGVNFTPSPDGSSITAPTASTVTSVDGVWSFGTATSGGNYNILLNGVPAAQETGSKIVINASGNAFIQSATNGMESLGR